MAASDILPSPRVAGRGSRLWAAELLTMAASLLGCGGDGAGGGDKPALVSNGTPTLALRAEVHDCKDVTLHDSGHVVYIVLGRTCSASARPHRVTLAMTETSVLSTPGAVTMDMADSTEADAVLIAGLGIRRVGLYRAGTWRTLPNKDSWSGRDGAGLLLFNKELYLLGGWEYGPTTSVVWKTRNLVHWEFVTDAPWPGRHGSGWLVHDNRMWVIGGDLSDDVWSSTDGAKWVQEIAHAPFGKRYTPNAASIDGWIVVYAGQSWGPDDWCNERPDCYTIAPRDVWRSRDGRQWELATANAPWDGRGLIHGSVVHDAEIYLIGGGLKISPPNERYAETSREFSDIWSSKDGISWTRRLEAFSFSARTHFSVVSTPLGCFVSDGSVGHQSTLSNDIFHAPDCLKFLPIPDTPPLQKRHASSLAYFNGSLVILGGPDMDNPGTAVWQYFP